MIINKSLKNQYKLTNTLFRIEADGKGYYIHGDEKFTVEEFKKMFPVPISFFMYKNGNADKTKDYLRTY